MILGRTPEGAIKTKTDNGLRAVNCACCGAPVVCPCDMVKVPSRIYNILNNLTSASQCTLFGSTAAYFEIIDDQVYAEWSGYGSPFFGYFVYQRGSPCFLMGFWHRNEEGQDEVPTYSGYCGDVLGLTSNKTDFKINGITLPAFYWYPYSWYGRPSSKAVFVFS
jgi:hypothetical protein